MTRAKPKHDQIFICYESFGSSHPEGGCMRGTRLPGDHPKVQRWPQYFLPDGTDDAEIHRVRTKLWADAGAPAGPQ